MTREYKYLKAHYLFSYIYEASAYAQGPLLVQIQFYEFNMVNYKKKTQANCSCVEDWQGINKLWPTTIPQPQTSTKGHD